GTVERLTSSDNSQVPGSWSPDGRTLAFAEQQAGQGRRIRLLSRSDRSARSWLDSTAEEGAPRFSPDGRWLAYVSNEPGRPDVYVGLAATPSAGRQASSGGGTEPVW